MKSTLIALLGLLVMIADGQESPSHKHHADSTGAKVKSERSISLYVCPMHSDVRSENAGPCPRCRMDLVKTASVKVKGKQSVYTCPMHSEVTSEKPGKCPKCTMTLVLKQNT
jgi:Cu+-exporting ATPase